MITTNSPEVIQLKEGNLWIGERFDLRFSRESDDVELLRDILQEGELPQCSYCVNVGAGASSPTITIENGRNRYEEFPLTLYTVGDQIYVSGWYDPTASKDVLLRRIFRTPKADIGDALMFKPHGFKGNDLPSQLEPTRATNTNGATHVLNANGKGKLDVKLGGAAIAIELSHTDELINLDEYKEHYERSLGVPIEGKEGLGAALMLRFFHEYTHQVINQDAWRHQPAILLAVGRFLLSGESKRGWVSSPTGTGKTRVQAKLIETAIAAGIEKPIYVTSRRTLLDQTKDHVDGIIKGVSLSQYDGRMKSIEGDAIITTYNSIGKLLEELKARGVKPGLVIWDEAHNLLQTRRGLIEIEGIKDTPQIGFTATPGIEITLNDIGLEKILEIPLSYAIEAGCLPSIVVQRAILRLNEAEQTFKQSYRREAYRAEVAEMEASMTVEAKVKILMEKSFFMDDKRDVALRPTLIEADSVEEAFLIEKRVKEEFARVYGGLKGRVGVISSALPDGHNSRVLQRAKDGTLDIVIGVDMLSEGLDLPRFEVIILKPWRKSQYRPFQDMGRVMRLAPNRNPCLIVEIWPYEDADDNGYRSALEILGVRFGDGRVAFTSAREYEEQVRRMHRLDEIRPTSGIVISPSYTWEKAVSIGVRSRRNRELVEITILNDIKGIVLPRYKKYLEESGTSALTLRYHKEQGFRFEVNAPAFERACGFRWGLIPYFRLSQEGVEDLCRAMYQVEVEHGGKIPSEVILDGDQFVRYACEVAKGVGEFEVKMRRSGLLNRIVSDFGLGSVEYTLGPWIKELADQGILSDSLCLRDNLSTANKFSEWILLHEMLINAKEQFIFLQELDTSLDTEVEELFSEIEELIKRFISECVYDVRNKLNGYRSTGRINSDPIWDYHSEELLTIEGFVNQALKNTLSLRYDKSYLQSSVRGEQFVTYIYRQVLEELGMTGEDPYNVQDLETLLSRIVERIEMLGIVNAEALACLNEEDRKSLLLMKKRMFQEVLTKYGITWDQFFTQVCFSFDPEYRESWEFWSKEFSKDRVVQEIVSKLRLVDLTPERIRSISSSNLLDLLDRERKYVFPRIFIQFSQLYKSNGRTRTALRAFARANDINLEALIKEIKEALLNEVR